MINSTNYMKTFLCYCQESCHTRTFQIPNKTMNNSKQIYYQEIFFFLIKKAKCVIVDFFLQKQIKCVRLTVLM